MSVRPLPYIYEHATNLKAEARKVFEFHLQPKNLGKVNPSWIRVVSLAGPEKVNAGAILKLKVASFRLPQTWEVRVASVEDFSGTPAKASILDEAVRGPFPFWRHLTNSGRRQMERPGWWTGSNFCRPAERQGCFSCRSSSSC